jgi:hypothetical protein
LKKSIVPVLFEGAFTVHQSIVPVLFEGAFTVHHFSKIKSQKEVTKL